jgi:hypothetical protein
MQEDPNNKARRASSTMYENLNNNAMGTTINVKGFEQK